jgi:hypothetical protein
MGRPGTSLNPGAQSLSASVSANLASAIEDAQGWGVLSDDLTSKIRIGLALLNGTSLVAMLGIASGESTLATGLGFSPSVAVTSFAAFFVGMVLAGVCLFSHQNELIEKAGYAKARLTILRTAWTSLNSPNVDRQREEQVLQMLNAAYERNKQLLDVNAKAIHAQHWSAGAWLAGVLTPLLQSPAAGDIWQRVVSICS